LPQPLAISASPVALIRIGLGDDGRMLAALVELGYRGVVIEAMGAGHVPAHLALTIGELARTMPVVLSTRTGCGPVFTQTYGFDGSEIDLIARGVIPGGLINGVKARLLLQLLIALDLPSEALTFAYEARCGGHWARAEPPI